jgi:hypothetical protein
MTPTEYGYARRRLGCKHTDMERLIGIGERTSKRYEYEGPVPKAIGMLLALLTAHSGDLASLRKRMRQ